MVDTIRHKEWFDMAKKDLKGAEILYEHGADYGIVCFHCQQAIEKALKSFLISVTGELQDGHSLLKLCKKSATYHILFSEMQKDMTFVNAYYIETRYPAEDPLVVTKNDVDECMRISLKVLQMIDAIIHSDV